MVFFPLPITRVNVSVETLDYHWTIFKTIFTFQTNVLVKLIHFDKYSALHRILFMFYMKSSKISSLVRRKQKSEPCVCVAHHRHHVPGGSRDRIQGPGRKIGSFIQHLTASYQSFTQHQLGPIRRSVEVNVVEAKVDQLIPASAELRLQEC